MKDKSKKILTIFLICMLISLVIGYSAAYFILRVKCHSAPSKIETAILPSIIFEVGPKIDITATYLNFNKDMESLMDETYVSATLKNGNTVETANAYYDIDLSIEKNNYIYSTESKRPEIIINIYDNNNNEITEIEGLEYVTVGNLKGFDITNKTGNYNVVNNYKISTKDEKEDKWKMKCTFINLDEVQQKNGHSNLRSILKISNSNSNEG